MHQTSTSRKALRALPVALSIMLFSCSGLRDLYREVDASVARGQYDRAIREVRDGRQAYGDKSSVLYKLDLGLLQHYAGQPDSSTRWLHDAEREIEDLYTRSISLAAVSMLLNDNVLPYEGEEFEKVLVSLFLALNYATSGDAEGALVEARKADLKLKDATRRYEGKNGYQEDAFLRYIAGVLYENAGEINDAFISYRRSYEAYRKYRKVFGTGAPPVLLDDLVRTATLMGFTEEAEEYTRLGGAPYKRRNPRPASILVISYVGPGPAKQEIRPSVSIPDSAGTLHTFQIALPTFVPRYRGTRDYLVEVLSAADSGRAGSGRTTLAEDVTALARQSLEDRIGLIYLKSGGRALLKFLAAEKAKSELKKKEDKTLNVLGSIAIDLFVGATEQADLRTWRTLPAQFQISRIMVPPGEFLVNVRASDGGFSLTGKRVRVRQGETAFVIADDLR